VSELSIFYGARRRRAALWLGVAVALCALVVGGLVSLASPLIALGTLGALAVAVWALTNLEIGLWGAIGIITLLPFAALPFKLVFTPTFLDLAVGGTFLVYVMQWMTGRRRRLALTPAHGPIFVFLALAVFSFVAGLPNGPLTPNLMRQFAELLINIALCFVVVDYVDNWDKFSRITRVILLGGTAAALLGIGLYVIPAATANRVLSALSVFGYPGGDVLRYIEDDPANAQRAIGTAVDPNFFGGVLATVGGLLAPQVLSRKPVLGSRWLSLAAFGAVVGCLVLTFSRGAMVGLAVGMTLVVVLRYRRLLIVMAAAGLAILILPVTHDYVVHFLQGLQGQDLATQMRFGEYKDALILIQRYPVLGVGFSGAPEIDIYLGVSSAYLLMAEQMGLIGLAVFAIGMATVFLWSFSQRRHLYAAAQAAAGQGQLLLWLGAHAGLAAALVVGVVDHYFFELSFQPAGSLFWIFVGLCLAASRLAAGWPISQSEREAGVAPAGAVGH
jgi:O-antigen ligase